MNMTQEKLLMLGTSYGSIAMIEYAKSQGIHTIVTDYLPPSQSKAKFIADEYWMINTGDIDILEEKCIQENVNIVICGISEFNLEMTMELCRRLHLPCYCTPEAWHYSKDKADFKKICNKIGVPVPKDYFVSEKLTNEEIENIKFPVMVKPVDLSGNRGISYCHNRNQFIDAYKLARSVSKNPKIIVERMLHGEEWWAGYALANGKISLISLNAMYAQPGFPKNCYTLTTSVSNHVSQFISEVNPKIEELLATIGCKEGFAWVQLMLDEDGHFYIIEMGYRLTGEMLYMMFNNLCGFNTVKWLVDYARGIKHAPEELPISQSKAYSNCITAIELWAHGDGSISKMTGFDEISNLPNVYVETLKDIGDNIIKYRPLGNVVFSSKNIDDMCKMIQLVNDKVHVYNEKEEDVIIKYTDFDYLRKVYYEGLNGE